MWLVVSVGAKGVLVQFFHNLLKDLGLPRSVRYKFFYCKVSVMALEEVYQTWLAREGSEEDLYTFIFVDSIYKYRLNRVSNP